MNRLAVIALFLAYVGSCGPNDGTRSSGGTNGGRKDGGVVTCANAPKDSDNDGISDEDEGANEHPPRDTDRDGMPDYKDEDSDGDGIPDAIEGRNGSPCNPPVDSDGDGKPDFRDLDSDDANDGTVPDSEEAGPDPTNPVDTNGDGKPDYMDPDNDGDHISDLFELTPVGASVAANTLAAAPDTDSDGVPDFRDTDSDGDLIADIDEGSVDTDGDLVGNWRDLDSDGDCVPDSAEAGDVDPATPPVDSDGDGAPDFEDTDSDNDGLTDGKEDRNCNGVLDSCETNRLIADTDGDTVSDLIEYQDCTVKDAATQAATNCQCDGADSGKSPLSRGDFVFVSDYMVAPVPNQETLNLTTNVSRADVVFMLDTTASMGACANDIAVNIKNTIVPGVKTAVSDAAFGLIEFKDFTDAFVVRYDYRVQTVRTPPALDVMNHSSIAYALQNVIMAGGGNDGPEAGWEALYSLVADPAVPPLTGGGTPWTSNVTATQPTTPLVGEEQGTVAQARFRTGAVPIIVGVTDIRFHDKPGAVATDPAEDGKNDYGSGTDCASGCNGVPSREDAIARVNAIGGHVMGLAINGNAEPKDMFKALAQATGAVVKPSDFPAGRCAAGQCCTGAAGAGEAPLGGTDCPLSYSIHEASFPVTQGIIDGIKALASGLHFDVHVVANDVDAGTVDNFIDKLVPNVSGVGPAAMCVVVPTAQLLDNFLTPHALPKASPTAPGDGVLDTFLNLSGAVQICFDVIPKENVTIMNTTQPQFFRAQLQVIGQTKTANMTNNFNLGTPRDVFFLVPPVIVNGPIN